MKRIEAARYARWSAAVAFLLAGLTTAVYLQRGWKRHIEKQNAPPAAPRDVMRLSSGLTFSKVEQNRTIFTVQASKSTEFKDKDASLLEDVKITIFGKTGERHDTIHTQSCQYGMEKGEILCTGDVQIDLQSARDAERAESNPNGTAAKTVPLAAMRIRVVTKGSVPGAKLNCTAAGCGLQSTSSMISRVPGSALDTKIGTMAPFSATAGATSVTSALGAGAESSAASASANVFAAKATAGPAAAARAMGSPARPMAAIAPAP